MYKSGNEKEYFSELFICRLGEKLGLPMAHYELDGEYIRSKVFSQTEQRSTLSLCAHLQTTMRITKTALIF